MARADISALELILEDAAVLVVGQSVLTQCVECGGEEGGDCPLCTCWVCDDCQSLHTTDCHLLARALQLGLQLSPEIIIMLRLLSLRKQGGEFWQHIGNIFLPSLRIMTDVSNYFLKTR